LEEGGTTETNDDDFDEGENEDVENLTLNDEEFDLVNTLSANSLGLQVGHHSTFSPAAGSPSFA
jgi:hypothetical protein